jgi:hypothetical protein
LSAGPKPRRFLAKGIFRFEVEYLTERTNFPVVMPGHASPSGPARGGTAPVSLKSGGPCQPLPMALPGQTESVAGIVRYETIARWFKAVASCATLFAHPPFVACVASHWRPIGAARMCSGSPSRDRVYFDMSLIRTAGGTERPAWGLYWHGENDMPDDLPSPIPRELRDAFWGAIGAYSYWHHRLRIPMISPGCTDIDLARDSEMISPTIPILMSPGARGVLAVWFLASAKPRGQS